MIKTAKNVEKIFCSENDFSKEYFKVLYDAETSIMIIYLNQHLNI